MFADTTAHSTLPRCCSSHPSRLAPVPVSSSDWSVASGICMKCKFRWFCRNRGMYFTKRWKYAFSHGRMHISGKSWNHQKCINPWKPWFGQNQRNMKYAFSAASRKAKKNCIFWRKNAYFWKALEPSKMHNSVKCGFSSFPNRARLAPLFQGFNQWKTAVNYIPTACICSWITDQKGVSNKGVVWASSWTWAMQLLS